MSDGTAIHASIMALGEQTATLGGRGGFALTLPRPSYDALVLHLGTFIEYGMEKVPVAFESAGMRFVFPKPEHIAVDTPCGMARIYEAEGAQ